MIFILFSWALLTIITTLLIFLTELVNIHFISFQELNVSNFLSWNFIITVMYFQKSMDNLNSNPMGIITPLTLLAWSFVLIAITCECGERCVTERFHLFEDKLNRCKWYLMTLNMQRMVLIFISDAQQPAYMHGFANIVCTRDYFKKVWMWSIC